MAFDFSQGDVVTPASSSGGGGFNFQNGQVVPQASQTSAPVPGDSISSFAKGSFDTAASGFSDLKDIASGPNSQDMQDVQDATRGGGFGAGVAQSVAGAAKTTERAVGDVGKMVGGAMGTVASPILGPVSKVGSEIGEKIGSAIPSDIAMKFEDMLRSHPEIGKNATDIMNMANLAFSEKAAPAVKGAAEGTMGAADSALGGIKTKISAGNVDPRLEASASRVGTSDVSALDKYNEFAKKEDAAKTDVKADGAGETVGSRIGDAYDAVIKQRQDAGKQMGDEIKKFGDKPTPIDESIGSFQKDLIDNGATYDAIKHQVDGGPTSKFSTTDKTILTKYATELQALGKNPTAAQLDAFISRMPKEIEGLKATSGINFQTNAERLVNNNISSLRESLGKVGTPEYNAARKAYADHSQFLDEGAKYLGGKTQSGDYSRDFSVAKSSVQSLLSGGKKDWLMELENKTGYPALDEATLASQAMKDAGNAKGESLLKLMSDKPPTTSGGVTKQMIDWGAAKIKNAVVGSPADQTRTFLKSLQGDKSTPASDYLKSTKNLQIGLSIKSTVKSPNTIAGKLSPLDYKAIKEYIGVKQGGGNAQVPFKVYSDLEDVLEKHGLSDTGNKPTFSSENALVDYLTSVTDSYDNLGDSKK